MKVTPNFYHDLNEENLSLFCLTVEHFHGEFERRTEAHAGLMKNAWLLLEETGALCQEKFNTLRRRLIEATDNYHLARFDSLLSDEWLPQFAEAFDEYAKAKDDFIKFAGSK